MSGMVELEAAAATGCESEMAAADAGSVDGWGDNGLCLSVFFKLLDLPLPSPAHSKISNFTVGFTVFTSHLIEGNEIIPIS